MKPVVFTSVESQFGHLCCLFLEKHWAVSERTQVWPWCCRGLPAWPWVRLWAIMAFSVPSIVKRSLRPLFPWMMLFTLLASPRAQALTTSLCCLGYNTWELLFLFITTVVKKSIEGGSLEVGGPFGGVELVQFPRSGQNINMSLVYGCVTHADRWCFVVVVQLLSCVRLFVTPWTAADAIQPSTLETFYLFFRWSSLQIIICLFILIEQNYHRPWTYGRLSVISGESLLPLKNWNRVCKHQK